MNKKNDAGQYIRTEAIKLQKYIDKKYKSKNDIANEWIDKNASSYRKMYYLKQKLKKFFKTYMWSMWR